MSVQVEAYDVTCAASVAASAPVEVDQVTDESVNIVRATVRIPAGHAGLTGIALAYGHQPVIPRNNGAYLSGDDDTFQFDLVDYPAGVPWTVFVCNLDLQSHVWQITWEMETEPVGTTPAAPVSLPPATIYSGMP